MCGDSAASASVTFPLHPFPLTYPLYPPPLPDAYLEQRPHDARGVLAHIHHVGGEAEAVDARPGHIGLQEGGGAVRLKLSMRGLDT